jgi:hypothetical protein
MIIDGHNYELVRENDSVYLCVDGKRMRSHWKPEALTDARPVCDFQAEITKAIQETLKDNGYTLSFSDCRRLVEEL